MFKYEYSFGGKVIALFSQAISYKMWIWASKLAASTAQMSIINALIGPAFSDNSVYAKYEFPILIERFIRIIETIFGG